MMPQLQVHNPVFVQQPDGNPDRALSQIDILKQLVVYPDLRRSVVGKIAAAEIQDEGLLQTGESGQRQPELHARKITQ